VIDLGFDFYHQLATHVLKLKIYRRFKRFHIGAGDLSAVVALHHATQNMEGRMRPHQRWPAFPVQTVGKRASDSGGLAFDFMPNFITHLVDISDCPVLTLSFKHASIGRLPATTQIKGMSV